MAKGCSFSQALDSLVPISLRGVKQEWLASAESRFDDKLLLELL